MELIKNPTELCRYVKSAEHFELFDTEAEWLLGILEGHDFAVAVHENQLYRVDIAEEISEHSDRYMENIASLFWWAYQMWNEIVEHTKERIEQSLLSDDISQELYALTCYENDEPMILALEKKVTAWTEETELFVY